MGKKNKDQNEHGAVEPVPSPNDEPQEPEYFDPSLLELSAAQRQNYFERECVMPHPHLEDALDKILRAICSPGDGPDLNRLASIVLVIGPSRVGKTTLIGKLQEKLLERAQERMRRDPSFYPFVTIEPPGSGRFDWMNYFKPVLRQLGDPFVDSKSPAIRMRDWEEATLEAFIQRHPYAVIIDEAQHLAKASMSRTARNQLDQLKHFENRTGVCHVLVGTYEMRPFRKASPQLSGRSIDVHFPRYDATEQKDREIFRSVLWALQRQLPVEKEPLLMENYWEFLYARSIGCIGLLKLHLNRALEYALSEEAKTVTEEHLRATAPSEDRVKQWLATAISGEEELVEPEGADERLLIALGLREPKKAKQEGESAPGGTKGGSSQKKKQLPGNRNPGRDPIGSAGEEEEDPLNEDEDDKAEDPLDNDEEKQAAG